MDNSQILADQIAKYLRCRPGVKSVQVANPEWLPCSPTMQAAVQVELEQSHETFVVGVFAADCFTRQKTSY